MTSLKLRYCDQQNTLDTANSDSSRQQRSVIITETVMKQFLDKIGYEHYIHFDQYHPGLEWTSTGYVYNPYLMDANQSKNLSSLIG